MDGTNDPLSDELPTMRLGSARLALVIGVVVDVALKLLASSQYATLLNKMRSNL